MVTLKINGTAVTVPEGTMVLRAAAQAGIAIPRLCDHPQLEPYGGCRLCVVEVEGMRLPIASCTLPVAPNMVVQTDTPQLREARQFVLGMLFSERNHFCPFCQVSGKDCDLQQAAYAEGMTHWPIQPGWQQFALDTSHPFFVMEHNRCILCRRCVRACGELVGNFTLGMEERGSATLLTADTGVPWGASTCIGCGTCVQVCPTGALFEKDNPYVGQDADSTATRSICLQCSVGCGIDVKTRGNHLVRILGDWESAVNGGLLCKAGRVLPLHEQRERLTTPLIRRAGQLQPATWDEALTLVTERLRPLRGQNGHGVAALASTRLSIEALNAFRQLFNMGLATSIEEGVPTATSAAQAQQTGQAFESDLRALHAADCVVLVGANPLASHEVVSFFIKRHLPHGLRLIVIDPQNTEFTDRAHVHLTPAKGQDAALLAEITAALGHATVVRDDVRATAEILHTARQIVFVYGKGVTAQRTGDALTALLNLVTTLKQTGAQAHLLSLKGEANSLAAAQLGLDQPFVLNGQQAVYLALGDDVPSENLTKRLEKAPFLVAQAAYRSPLTDQAEVVLPVEMWAETEGHYLNLDGRLQSAQAALQPPAQVRSNTAVFRDLANAWGQPLADDWRDRLNDRVACVPLQM